MNKKEYYRQNIIVNGFVIDCVQDNELLYRIKFVNDVPVNVFVKKWFDTEDIDFEFLLSQQL